MDVSESVGLGLWQLPVILVSLYRGIPSAMLMMNYNFAASKTAFWCRNDTGGERNTFDASIIVSNLSEELGACHRSENGVVTNCNDWNFDHSVFLWTLVEEVSLLQFVSFCLYSLTFCELKGKIPGGEGGKSKICNPPECR